jgi:peptidoglycan hydrolase-like protein with peptidoglycan-binding domain
MKRLTWVVLSIVVFASAVSAQNSNSATSTNKNQNKSTANANRRPIFRATADQIKQAQAILKQRSFYPGDQNGKLDDATRAGLKKYQEAEGLKVTGTLNKVTLEKMAIALTDKQKTM